jgi:2,5-dioxopentanoate dehydrogenase
LLLCISFYTNPTIINFYIIPQFMYSTPEQIEQAMQRSYAAFLSYRYTSGHTKANFLRNIASQIEALGGELIQMAMSETNLPEPRLAGERGRTCMQLRQLADVVAEGSWIEATIDTAIPDRQPLPKPDVRNMLVPIGPVVVFGASNFPFAYSTAGVDPASAWAAGCSVVVKAHPAHPQTSALVASAIHKAVAESGVPQGVFEHLDGVGFELGETLVMHPRTAAVGFTGSFAGGKALFDMANRRAVPIPVFAEMGSTNPVFLLPDSLEKNAESHAKMYAGSITGSMGQFCTKPGLIFGLKSPALDRFVHTLSQEITQIQPAAMLHTGIATAFRTKRAEVLANAAVNIEAETTQNYTDSQGIPSIASVSAQQFLANTALHQEIFGPFALIISCDNIAEIHTIAAHLEGQLTSTIMGTDEDLAQNTDLISAVSLLCGRLILNGIPTGVEVCTAMQHGGPFPASTDGRFGSVGARAIKRFVRPLAFQNFPERLLPNELKTENALNIWRMVNNEWRK